MSQSSRLDVDRARRAQHAAVAGSAAAAAAAGARAVQQVSRAVTTAAGSSSSSTTSTSSPPIHGGHGYTSNAFFSRGPPILPLMNTETAAADAASHLAERLRAQAGVTVSTLTSDTLARINSGAAAAVVIDSATARSAGGTLSLLPSRRARSLVLAPSAACAPVTVSRVRCASLTALASVLLPASLLRLLPLPSLAPRPPLPLRNPVSRLLTSPVAAWPILML